MEHHNILEQKRCGGHRRLRRFQLRHSLFNFTKTRGINEGKHADNVELHRGTLSPPPAVTTIVACHLSNGVPQRLRWSTIQRPQVRFSPVLCSCLRLLWLRTITASVSTPLCW